MPFAFFCLYLKIIEKEFGQYAKKHYLCSGKTVQLISEASQMHKVHHSHLVQKKYIFFNKKNLEISILYIIFAL